MRGGALRQHNFRSRRRPEHGRQRAGIHVAGMRVRAQDQVRVGRQRGVQRPRSRQAGVDVEHDALVLHREAAMTQPPKRRGRGLGGVHLLDHVVHRCAARVKRSSTAAQRGSSGGRSTAIQSQPSPSSACRVAYNAAA